MPSAIRTLIVQANSANSQYVVVPPTMPPEQLGMQAKREHGGIPTAKFSRLTACPHDPSETQPLLLWRPCAEQLGETPIWNLSPSNNQAAVFDPQLISPVQVPIDPGRRIGRRSFLSPDCSAFTAAALSPSPTEKDQLFKNSRWDSNHTRPERQQVYGLLASANFATGATHPAACCVVRGDRPPGHRHPASFPRPVRIIRIRHRHWPRVLRRVVGIGARGIVVREHESSFR